MEEPTPLVTHVADRIRRHGPVGFDVVMADALLHPRWGFFATGGAAGRRGDFLTSPEVGPLFGAVLARALDGWWDELGRPDPFVVVEAGAGVGTLAVAVRHAAPRCGRALTYVLVEAAAPLRAEHGRYLPLAEPAVALPPGATSGPSGDGPRFVSLTDLPATPIRGCILANELLDNLPTQLLERTAAGWAEVRVGVDDDDGDGSGAGVDRLVEVLVPVDDDRAVVADRLAPEARPGARIPLQLAAAAWLERALETVEVGRVVVIDYADRTASLADRPWSSWLRTYRQHGRGGPPLDHLGDQDVTVEVALDQLARVRPATTQRTQAEFLRAHGLDELVDEGRRIWHERAAIGDLEALRHRSRVREAEALTDATGLGAFLVLEWQVP